MHINIEKETILNLIDHVEGIVEKRNTIPILSNILIDAEGQSISVTATDLSITAREKVDGIDVIVPGKVTVSSSIFAALIRKMPGNAVIEMKLENNRMVIRGGRIRFEIPVLPAEDFPIGKETQSDPVTMSIDSLSRALRLVRDSMSTEETRYYLNGAFLAIENESLVAVSTDGHRLSVAKIDDINIDRPDAIVPRKAVSELLKILPDFEGQMSVRIDQGSISFQMGNLMFSSKLIDGTFPDYSRIMPRDSSIVVKFNPADLQQAIDRVSIVSSEKTSAIKLVIEKDKMTIIAINPDTGSAQEEVIVESTDDITVGYNGRYLREILNGYQGCEIMVMNLTNESSPTLIHPENSIIDRSVLMPMRI